MGTRTLVSLLVLCALATSARADCDACVAGFCYSRRTLIQGFQITDQLAIDRTNNVLYAQLNSNLNTAFFLDDHKMQLVQTLKTSGMAVDQHTQNLYMGTNEIENTFYKYNLTSNITETLYMNSTTLTTHTMHTDYMYYGDNKLHFVDKGLNSLQYINEADGEMWQKKHLKAYSISDFVIDNEQNYFYVSNNTVYMYNDTLYNNKKPPTVILRNHHVLSTDADGVVYFGDASQMIVYKRDSSGDMELYALYKTGSLEDFVFDKRNNVVFRDEDGSVARWERSPGQARCLVHPPHAGFLITELADYSPHAINLNQANL